MMTVVKIMGYAQDMTTVLKIVGYVAPTKEDIVNFMVRGISGMVPVIGGTINLRGTAFPAIMMCLVILHRVWEKPVFMRNE
jgi:hypothetical protein